MAPKSMMVFVPALALAVSSCGGTDGNGAAGERFAAASDADAEVGLTCELVGSTALPNEVRETSGLARSLRDPNRFWTHNDAGNEPVLFALAEAGGIVQRVRVTGATLQDWEDMESAPCADGRPCLYVGDIGDNNASRDHITVYRVPEPEAGASATAPAEALLARYPDGARDAEALFVDAAGRIFVVTKGRREEIALYRYPASPTAGSTSTLERVRVLFPRPRNAADRVTAATATPDRRWIGLRTYRTLHLYPAAALLSGTQATPIAFDLGGAGGTQGESLVIANDGAVWISSEAESMGQQPRWSRLSCELPA